MVLGILGMRNVCGVVIMNPRKLRHNQERSFSRLAPNPSVPLIAFRRSELVFRVSSTGNESISAAKLTVGNGQFPSNWRFVSLAAPTTQVRRKSIERGSIMRLWSRTSRGAALSAIEQEAEQAVGFQRPELRAAEQVMQVAGGFVIKAKIFRYIDSSDLSDLSLCKVDPT